MVDKFSEEGQGNLHAILSKAWFLLISTHIYLASILRYFTFKGPLQALY